METRVLIIDDEPQIRKVMNIGLSSLGYSVEEASTGAEGLLKVASFNPDLVLLDLGLPDQHGSEVLVKMKETFSGVIIIIPAQSNIEEMLNAVSLGADDYIVKPFRMHEIIGKTTMILANSGPALSGIIEVGNLTINKASSIVTIDGKIIDLTTTEYLVLLFIANNRGRLLTTEKILAILANPIESNSQHLKSIIKQLRRKIESDADRPGYIVNESNFGYRFIGPVAEK